MSDTPPSEAAFEAARERLVAVSVKDPLSDVTRKERRFLLGTSVLCFAIVHAGLVPTRIAALGIDVSQADRRALLNVLMLIVGYFLAAFITYAASDFIAWRIAFYGAYREFGNTPIPMPIRDAEERLTGLTQFRKQVHEIKFPTSRFSGSMSLPVSLARAAVEFVLPIAFGGYALYLLATARL